MRYIALVIALLGLAGCADVNPFNEKNLAIVQHGGGSGAYDLVPAYAEGPQQAVFVDSAEEADLTVYTTWRPSRPKAYIGRCQAAADGPRLKLYRTDEFFKADIKVQLVERESEAAYGQVFCTE